MKAAYIFLFLFIAYDSCSVFNINRLSSVRLETTLVYFPDVFGAQICVNSSCKDFNEQFPHATWYDNASVIIDTKSVTFLVDRDD